MTSTTIVHEVGIATGMIIKETPSGNLFIYDADNVPVRIEKADRLDLVKTLLEIGRGDNPLPISDSMVDAALLAHTNESRFRYGLSKLMSLEDYVSEGDTIERVWGDERKKMRIALEAALNHREAS